MAIGMAAFVAIAQGGDGAVPQTTTNTVGVVGGGNITSSHTGTFSIDFSYGPTPVSVTISLTSVGTYGFEPLAVNTAIHDAFSGVGSSAFPGIA